MGILTLLEQVASPWFGTSPSSIQYFSVSKKRIYILVAFPSTISFPIPHSFPPKKVTNSFQGEDHQLVGEHHQAADLSQEELFDVGGLCQRPGRRRGRGHPHREVPVPLKNAQFCIAGIGRSQNQSKATRFWFSEVFLYMNLYKKKCLGGWIPTNHRCFFLGILLNTWGVLTHSQICSSRGGGPAIRDRDRDRDSNDSPRQPAVEKGRAGRAWPILTPSGEGFFMFFLWKELRWKELRSNFSASWELLVVVFPKGRRCQREEKEERNGKIQWELWNGDKTKQLWSTRMLVPGKGSGGGAVFFECVWKSWNTLSGSTLTITDVSQPMIDVAEGSRR